MKKIFIRVGDTLTKIGERHNIRCLVYNPITWARFLTSSRHGGRIFAQVIEELFPEVKTCLDVGSGAGGYVYWFNRTGRQAIGLEYSRLGRFIASLQGATTLKFDCNKSDRRPLLGPFDLVYSIEVAEHVPRELEDPFLDYIASQGSFVIFSAAQPDQPGQGHINPQPLHHWRQAFAKRRLEYSEQDTHKVSMRLRQLGFRGFFPRNCQVFRRSSTTTGS